MKLNFLREGILVQEYTRDDRKKPNVTGIPKEKAKNLKYHKCEKQEFLLTQNPEIFGTTQKFLPA